MVQAPHRHVALAGADQLAQGDLLVGVGAQQTGARGEAPRLSQVREHGSLVGAQLQLARQLRQGHHGAAELTGQHLEPSADLGHLDLAALRRGPPRHQLQVVDDDQPQVGAQPVLEATRLGTDLHHRQRRVVVDPQRALAQAAHRLGDLGPVGVGEPSGPELARVHPGLGRDQTLGQLQVSHLEREEQHREVLPDRGVRRDPQGERCLAHRRSGTDHDQRSGLQAGEHGVEVGVARRGAGDGVAALVEHLELLEAPVEQRRQLLQGVGVATLGDREHHRLGGVDGLLDVVERLVAQLCDLVGGGDQAPQQRLLLDDAGVVLGVGDRRGPGLERDQRGRTAHGVEHAGRGELLGHGDRVHALSGAVEGLDRREDVAVRRLVEVVLGDDVRHRRDGVLGQQHGAEERLLGIDAVGRDPRTDDRLVGGAGQVGHADLILGPVPCGHPDHNPGSSGDLPVEIPWTSGRSSTAVHRRSGRHLRRS